MPNGIRKPRTGPSNERRRERRANDPRLQDRRQNWIWSQYQDRRQSQDVLPCAQPCATGIVLPLPLYTPHPPTHPPPPLRNANFLECEIASGDFLQSVKDAFSAREVPEVPDVPRPPNNASRSDDLTREDNHFDIDTIRKEVVERIANRWMEKLEKAGPP